MVYTIDIPPRVIQDVVKAFKHAVESDVKSLVFNKSKTRTGRRGELADRLSGHAILDGSKLVFLPGDEYGYKSGLILREVLLRLLERHYGIESDCTGQAPERYADAIDLNLFTQKPEAMKYDLPKLREIALVLENEGAFYRAYQTKLRIGARRELIKASAQQNGFGLIPKTDREQLRRYLDKIWSMPDSTTDDPDSDMAALPTIDIHTDNTPEPEPTDYRKLPDGTQLRLKNGKIVTKGVYDGPLSHVKPEYQCANFHAWLQTSADAVGHIYIDWLGRCQVNPDWSIDEVLPQESQPDQLVTITEGNLMDAIIEITTKTLVNGKDVATMSDSEVYDLIAAQETKIKELEKIETKPKKLVAEIEKRRAGIQALVDYLDSKS